MEGLRAIQLLRTLALMRWFAVLGQFVVIVACVRLLEVSLPLAPLLGGVAVLALGNALAWWHLRGREDAGAGALLLTLLFDVAVLTWQLYWSGGPTNPFVTLYLVPIALSAFVLPARWVLAAASMSAAAYTALMVRYEPLPHHLGTDSIFNLHVVGMWVNFLISASLVTWFATRLAAVLARQRNEVARAREHALRVEGILAVATQAAATAHEINTPLSTMAVLVDDLRDAAGSGANAADLDLLARQIAQCRDAVHRLVVETERRADAAPPIAIADLVARALDRWRLMRPQHQAQVSIAPDLDQEQVRDESTLTQLLLNLLNNAADASTTRGHREVRLALTREDDALRIEVGDRGPGFERAELPAAFVSTKREGLGLGLVLSRVIAERFGGSLSTANTREGAEVSVRLPMPALRAGAGA